MSRKKEWVVNVVLLEELEKTLNIMSEGEYNVFSVHHLPNPATGDEEPTFVIVGFKEG